MASDRMRYRQQTSLYVTGLLCCILADANCGCALARHALRYGYTYARAYRVTVWQASLAEAIFPKTYVSGVLLLRQIGGRCVLSVCRVYRTAKGYAPECLKLMVKWVRVVVGSVVSVKVAEWRRSTSRTKSSPMPWPSGLSV